MMQPSQEKRGGESVKNHNSDKDYAFPREKEHVYGIDRQNLDECAVILESDRQWNI